MHRYGQYCPVARAAEVLADRWTVLIVRELLADINHFNELERGLPHMSRCLRSGCGDWSTAASWNGGRFRAASTLNID
jgi:hypothetical protein